MPDAAREAGPCITACICTQDRPDYLRACLDGLARQTGDLGDFDIVVVDSCSGPDAAARVAALTAAFPNARLVRVGRSGLSLARNAGARAARGVYLAYIDDDAVAAPDWIASIRAAIARHALPPAVLGGRILPVWERPLPAWWPRSLRGVLSIIEHEGEGEFRSPALPAELEPYGANMVVRREAMLAAGGFDETAGRSGRSLLSDEDVRLAWTLQDAGHPARYDGRIVVRHSIQAARLNPAWLLRRLYWQGASTVVTRRLLGQHRLVRRALARRLAVSVLLLPAALVPRRSTRLIGLRWRLAYSLGFLAAASGAHRARAARLSAEEPCA